MSTNTDLTERSAITGAISTLLLSLGFDAMASACATETDAERIQHYARVIVKNTPIEFRTAVSTRLSRLGVL